MGAFLRNKEIFIVVFSSDTHLKPYKLYGNKIYGNKYLTVFNNKEGEVTEYFEKIINGVIADRIKISDEETKKIRKLDSVLEDGKNTELYFEVCFNGEYDEYMKKTGKINCLKVASKAGCTKNKDMRVLQDVLSKKYKLLEKHRDDEDFTEEEFTIISEFN